MDFLYMLTNNNSIIKANKEGQVLEEINVSNISITMSKTIVTADGEIYHEYRPKEINIIDGDLKVLFSNGLVMSILEPEIKKDTNLQINNGSFQFDAGFLDNYEESLCLPISNQAINGRVISSSTECSILYTSEIYYNENGLQHDRKLYFVDANRATKSVQLAPTSFIMLPSGETRKWKNKYNGRHESEKQVHRRVQVKGSY